jgi:hypothetical protein
MGAWARRESRLAKLQEAKAELESEARQQAEEKKAAVEARIAERREQEARTGKKTRGAEPKAPDPETAAPVNKAQRNFTDPQSRIMPSGSQKGAFAQGYNAQIAVEGIDLHVATGKQKHGEMSQLAGGDPPDAGAEPSLRERMKRKLASQAGRDVYRMRKAIVEPVFGQIKAWRGFRRFSLRGLDNVRGAWKLVCLTHNLLKLFRSGYVLEAC